MEAPGYLGGTVRQGEFTRAQVPPPFCTEAPPPTQHTCGMIEGAFMTLLPLTTMPSQPAATGLADSADPFMQRIKEICAHHIALLVLEDTMADFMAFADDLVQRPCQQQHLWCWSTMMKMLPILLYPSSLCPAIATISNPRESSTPLTPVPLLAQPSAAVPQHQTAHKCKWPCCRHDCHNLPLVPNTNNKALPSHPQPMLGGTSALMTRSPTLIQAISFLCSIMLSTMTSVMTSHSPSLQPFFIENTGYPFSREGDAHPFGDCGLALPPRKCAG
jgi:hypothetical protein